MLRPRPAGTGRGPGLYLASAAVACGLLLVAPAAAQAVTLYVDDSGSDPLNNCQTAAMPCLTIAQATAQAGAGNVIHLGGGTYEETVVLDNDESLIEDQTFSAAAAGAADVRNTAVVPAAPAITVMSAASTVQGLTVSSGVTAIRVAAAATISGNSFTFGNEPTGPDNADVHLTAGAGSPSITGNTFVDTDSSDGQRGVSSASAGSPTISNNSFDGFFGGIIVYSGGATPVISGNEITGTHGTGFQGVGIGVNNGAHPTVIGNHIHAPGAMSEAGLSVSQGGPMPDSGATFQRNRVTGAHQIGMQVSGTEGLVTLNSDLIAGANGAGIQMFELGGNGGGDVTATNVTVIDTTSASDIIIGNGADLTLDSSIVGAGNVNPGINDQGSGTCAISFSRGDGNNDCTTGFVSTAAPMFVAPGTDYHLQTGSPMIDAGNPTAPLPGVLDLDGGARALSGAAGCTLMPGTRDIGADEFVPATGIGCPAALTPLPVTSPAPRKKCKKGRRLKKGKCVRKKRKKP